MPLTCYCDDNADWYYVADNDFKPLATKRRRRCSSCDSLIELGADTLAFHCWRSPNTDIEEAIYGYEVPLATKYHCESCGGLFLALQERGYCIDLCENMRELAREQGDIDREAAIAAVKRQSDSLQQPGEKP